MGWSVTINNKTGESLDLMLWHFDRGGWRELWYFEKGGRQTGGQVPSANIAADDSVTFSWDVAPPEGISGRIVYAGESDSVDVSWTVSAPIAPSTDLTGHALATFGSGRFYRSQVTQLANWGSVTYDISSSADDRPPPLIAIAAGPQVNASLLSPLMAPAVAANRTDVSRSRRSPPYSGLWWVEQFRVPTTPGALNEPFRDYVMDFLAALEHAGLRNRPDHPGYALITALRLRQRSYLMHYASCLAKKSMKPADVPPYHPSSPHLTTDEDTHANNPSFLGIRWDHDGNDELSYWAAKQMWAAYGTGANPVGYPSNHNTGNAVDIKLSWDGDLSVRYGRYLNKDAPAPDPHHVPESVTISSEPRTHVHPDMIEIARSYGLVHFDEFETKSKKGSVTKTISDPNHFSITKKGH